MDKQDRADKIKYLASQLANEANAAEDAGLKVDLRFEVMLRGTPSGVVSQVWRSEVTVRQCL